MSNHPNVVKFHTSFLVDETLWLIMDYMSAGIFLFVKTLFRIIISKKKNVLCYIYIFGMFFFFFCFCSVFIFVKRAMFHYTLFCRLGSWHNEIQVSTRPRRRVDCHYLARNVERVIVCCLRLVVCLFVCLFVQFIIDLIFKNSFLWMDDDCVASNISTTQNESTEM